MVDLGLANAIPNAMPDATKQRLISGRGLPEEC